MKETLWGNNNFKVSAKKVLYFVNWVQSGIIRVRDLKIVNGKLDERYIMQTLKKKHNCYCEVMQIKQALKNYLGIVVNNTPAIINNEIINVNETSQIIYHELVQMKSHKPISETKWMERFSTAHINFENIYSTKVKKLIDKKVAEFNFIVA